MKRIIRLTESDLTRIVRRVIMEQETAYGKNVTSNVRVKPNATYTLQNNYMGYRRNPEGSVNEPSSYIKIPKGTVFKIDNNKKVAFATAQIGVSWTTNVTKQNPYGDRPRRNSQGKELLGGLEAVAADTMGSLFTTLKTQPVKISFDYGNEQVVSDSDYTFRIDRALEAALEKNLFNMG